MTFSMGQTAVFFHSAKGSTTVPWIVLRITQVTLSVLFFLLLLLSSLGDDWVKSKYWDFDTSTATYVQSGPRRAGPRLSNWELMEMLHISILQLVDSGEEKRKGKKKIKKWTERSKIFLVDVFIKNKKKRPNIFTQ